MDFAVQDSRGHHVLTTFKTQKRGIRRRPEEESFTSGCRAPGILGPVDNLPNRIFCRWEDSPGDSQLIESQGD